VVVVAFVLLAGASACGGNPSAEAQAARWADDVARAIRGADKEAQASNAVKRVPAVVSDEEVSQLQKELDDAVDEVVCNGAEVLVKAAEAHAQTNFDWSGWSSEQLDPPLASDFSGETIDKVGEMLDQVLDALEENLTLLKGVATACGIAHSGI
jgi:hypothetical protein